MMPSQVLGPQKLRGRRGHAPGERREGPLRTGFLSVPGMKLLWASHTGVEVERGWREGLQGRERERKGRQVGVGRGRETMAEAGSSGRWAAVHAGHRLHLRSLEEPRKEGCPAQLTAAERGRPLSSAGGRTHPASRPLGLLTSPCGGHATVPQQSHGCSYQSHSQTLPSPSRLLCPVGQFQGPGWGAVCPLQLWRLLPDHPFRAPHCREDQEMQGSQKKLSTGRGQGSGWGFARQASQSPQEPPLGSDFTSEDRA